MKMALFNGILGTSLMLLLGVGLLDLPYTDLILSIIASNLAGLVSLIFTLQAEKNTWIRKTLLNRSLKTWALLISLYLGLTLAASPILRNFYHLAILLIPLILTLGFCIILFGPIQDRIIHRQQRKIQNAWNEIPGVS